MDLDLENGLRPCISAVEYCRRGSGYLFMEFYQQHPIAAVLIVVFMGLVIFGFLYWLRELRPQKVWTPHTPYEPPRFEKRDEH